MKICKKCGANKTFDSFPKDANRPDGLYPYCKACNNMSMQAYRDANREKVRVGKRKSYAANKAAHKRYRQDNRDKLAAHAAGRRAAKLRATPIWADDGKTREMYELAELCTIATGIRHEVDHIVPLLSPIVCGLHWHGNMQILSKHNNITKGNRHWPDMPE